jgi:hypothetical protein
LAKGAVTMKHRRTGAVIGTDWQPEEADLPFTFSQVETRVNPAWAAERAARAEAFAAGRRTQISNRTPQTKRATAALKAESEKRVPRKRGSVSVKD